MKSPIGFVVVTAKGSAMEALIGALVETMTSRHGWVLDADDNAAIALVAADNLASADELIEKVPVPLRRNTIVVGMDQDGASASPGAGSLWQALERWQIAGEVSRNAMNGWEPVLSGFIGRKDLMGPFNTNCMKDSQSRNYCAWVSTPGEDFAEFLSQFGAVVTRVEP